MKEAHQELPWKKLCGTIADVQYVKLKLIENLQHTPIQGLTPAQEIRDQKYYKKFHVPLEIVIDGNLDEKSLFLAAIATATLRATAI